MSRIYSSLVNGEPARFAVLYGPGISDIYFDENQAEISFLFALTFELQSLGFRRVLHVSPTEPVHLLDPISEELTGSLFWPGRNETLKTGIIETIQTGPFGNPPIQSSTPQEKPGLGDVHGLRILDHLLHETNSYKTALVISNAESFLSHFPDKRTLTGVFGEWGQLPLQNQNTIFLVFNSQTKTDLDGVLERNSIPEIRAILYEDEQHLTRHVFLGGPESDEVEQLFKHIAATKRFAVDQQEYGRILKWIAAENVPLRIWYQRFSPLAQLDRQVLRENGWLVSSQADTRDLASRLDDLVGLGEVKQRILELDQWMHYQNYAAPSRDFPTLHMVFMGNPGTGKTTVARLLGEVFHEYAILTRGHLVEVSAADIISEFIGGSTQKTQRVIDKVKGGVLFIDEAYVLSEEGRGGFGQEVIDTLIPYLENDRREFVVILAGYTAKMRKFLKSNPGLQRRFPEENRFEFSDFSPEELSEILGKELGSRGLILMDEVRGLFRSIVSGLANAKIEGFGNGGEMRNLAEAVERRCKSRCAANSLPEPVVVREDIPERYLFYDQTKTLQVSRSLSELDQLVGLAKVKSYILSMVRLIQLDQVRRKLHPEIDPASKVENFIFTGNPGTGKTTVGRLIGKLYFDLGLLRKGHTVEVSGVDLIAGYVGQTALKTREIFEQALDGVLFIDEAYSLSDTQSRSSYGAEAVNTLVKLMEDYRERIVIIAAGYQEPMRKFIQSNPGLKSRFGSTLEFNDFSEEELKEIFLNLFSQEKFFITEPVMKDVLRALEIARLQGPHSFGNAREARNLFLFMKRNLAQRVFHDQPIDVLPESLPRNWNYFSSLDLEGYQSSGGSAQAASNFSLPLDDQNYPSHPPVQ